MSDRGGRPRIIAFLAVYNQESQIGWVLERFKPVLERGTIDEAIAVDDGSTDRTPDILRSCDYITVITHERNRGVGDAIRNAYRYALDRDYDIFVIMAGNGKDDPEEIERLVAPILNGEADYVQGSRYAKGGATAGLPVHRDLAIRTFTWTFSLFVGHRFSDCTNGFRAYRMELLRDDRVDWAQEWLRTYELEYYVHYKAVELGYRIREVPVSKIYRRSPDGSYSKIRARDWLICLKPLFYLRLGLKR
jgi:dolichol-phosphate mannosyltransferase